MQDLSRDSENASEEHQAYQDTYTQARDWLTDAVDKLTTCCDVHGDRHSLQAKLDKIMVSCLQYVVFGNCHMWLAGYLHLQYSLIALNDFLGFEVTYVCY